MDYIYSKFQRCVLSITVISIIFNNSDRDTNIKDLISLLARLY